MDARKITVKQAFAHNCCLGKEAVSGSMLFGVAHKNRITIPEVDRGLVFGLWGLHRPRRRPDPSPPPATDNRELADNRQEVSENPPGTFVKPTV